jgi:hypothetical protein
MFTLQTCSKEGEKNPLVEVTVNSKEVNSQLRTRIRTLDCEFLICGNKNFRKFTRREEKRKREGFMVRQMVEESGRMAIS